MWKMSNFQNDENFERRIKSFDVAPPFYRMHIDLIGKLKTSEDGNNFILHCVDSLTKYSFAIAIAKKDANSIADALVRNIFCIFGCPQIIISDEAKELLAEINNELNEKLGITHSVTSPYHPATNGQVERKNGYLMNILKMLVNENSDNWD